MALRSRRVAEIFRWTFREKSYRWMSIILFLIVEFTLVSDVSYVGGSYRYQVVGNVLQLAGSSPLISYPFLFALVSLLATLAIVVPRESGGFAALQALGYRRGEILVAQSISLAAFTMVPTLAAFLVLPPFVEPSLILRGDVAPLYPTIYWLAMPRTLMAILFLTLSASVIGMLIRRVSIAFAAMISFFFLGWYLSGTIGFPYGNITPPRVFIVAYGVEQPIPGIPLDPNWAFLLYLVGAAVAFLASLAYVGLRGELQ